MPIPNVRLMILAPIILPKLSWGNLWKAELSPINNSGKEDVMANKQKETKNSPHLNVRAILVKDFTNHVPDFISRKQDSIKIKI